jgi:hypothetical protein
VLISADLPWAWKLQLNLIALSRSWLQVVTVPDDIHINKISTKIVAEFAGNQPSFNFRIDDDDALAPPFLDAVLHHSDGSTEDRVLSFVKGFYLQAAGRKAIKLQPREYQNASVGLGLFSSGKRPMSIYALGNHVNVHRVCPVINVVNTRYWISTIHHGNDSAKRISKSQKPISANAARAHLEPMFPHLDFERAFAALAD